MLQHAKYNSESRCSRLSKLTNRDFSQILIRRLGIFV